jgi:hypothetical protein
MEKIIYWPFFILLPFFQYHTMPDEKKHGEKEKGGYGGYNSARNGTGKRD